MAKPKPPHTVSPVIKDLMTIVDSRGVRHQRLCKDAGIARHSISLWRHGRNSPTLVNFETLAHMLGYRVVLVPLEPAE